MGTFLAEHALAALISIVAAALATFLAKKVGNIMDAIEANANIDIDDKLEERVKQTVRRVVMAISQTFVTDLKKKGKFTDEMKKESLKRAIREAGQIIFEEIGVKKTTEQLRIAVEAEIGELKEVEKIVGMGCTHETK